MENVDPMIDADDLIGYGTAVKFLIWLTALMMRLSAETEEAA